MKTGAFWTWRRFTGIVLILGGALFQVSAWGPLTTLTDSKGTFVYSLPPQAMLEVVYQRQALWWWTNALFIVASLLMALGLALLTRLLREAGDPIFSQLGLILFICGVTLWCVQLAFRLSVDLWAARSLAGTGVLPDFYPPLALWGQALFAIYSVLAFFALAAYGVAVLFSRALPRWVGLLAIVYGLAGLGLLAFAGDAPPFLQYVPPMLIGVLLLRRPSLASRGSHAEVTATALVAEPS